MAKTDTTPEDALVRTVHREFKDSLSFMARFHKDWREYESYYLADQWDARRASWRPRPVVNYVSFIVDQKRPQITNNRPTGIILPVAPDDEAAAKLFTQVTDVVADRCDLDSVIDEVVHTGLLLDVAWFYVYWDNSLSGGSRARGNLWKGDVVVESVDPSNLYFDPQATTIDECRYIIYAIPKTPQWIKERYGVDVEPDTVQSFDTDIYDAAKPPGDSDRVMLYARFTRVDGKLNVAYVAGNRVLREDKDVYAHGRYPFIPFRAKERRKSILGISEARNIFENQKLLNKLIEMPTTSALLTANPIALIKRKSGIDKGQWLSKPGLVYEVDDPSTAVKWLQPPEYQGDVHLLTQKLIEYIEKIGGVYDAVTGQTPKGVTAASAIQLLQEQGSIPIKGISRNLYAALREVYKQIIALVQENYTETRYLRITGEDGGTEYIQFRGAEYAEVDFDVKVSAGASTPMSQAYIMQLAEDLFAKGLLQPSEYIDMIDGLPKKERLVARHREQEEQAAAMPPGQPGEAAAMQPAQQMTPGPSMPAAAQTQMPSVDEVYAQAPPQLQQEIDLLREQGMPDDQIMQGLMQLLQGR